MVNEFLDDEFLNEDLSEDIVATIANGQGNYDDILKILIDDGYISKDRFNEFALKNKLTTNTFLGNVNDELFDFIGDQALLIEDDNVIIDPFYVEMVKEYLDGNKN